MSSPSGHCVEWKSFICYMKYSVYLVTTLHLGLVWEGQAAGKFQTRAERRAIGLGSGSQWRGPPGPALGEMGRHMQVSVHGEFAREDNEASGLDGCFCPMFLQLSLSSLNMKGKEQGSWSLNVKFSNFSAMWTWVCFLTSLSLGLVINVILFNIYLAMTMYKSIMYIL